MQYLTIKVISESPNDKKLETIKQESHELVKDMFEQIKLKEAHENSQQGEEGINNFMDSPKQKSLKERLWK
jgi:hypothetical protein